MQAVPLKHWNDAGALLPVNIFTSKLQQSSIHMCRQMCIWCFENMPVWESRQLQSFCVSFVLNSLLEWRDTTVQRWLHLRLGHGSGRWSKPGRETWPSRTPPEIIVRKLVSWHCSCNFSSGQLTFPMEAMPLMKQMYTTHQAVARHITSHHCSDPPISMSGVMFRVVRYQK